MTIFSEFGFRRSRLPLTNAQTLNAKAFALEQLVSIHCTTFDLRWAMVELAWRSFTGMCAVAQGQFVSLARKDPTPRDAGGARPALLLLTPWWQQGAASLGHVSGDRETSMITLYGFGAGFGLPEISPFVTKTEVQLKMAGIAYRKEKAKPPASPKGQLPYIVDEAETHRQFHLHSCPSRSQIRFRLRRAAQPAGARAGLGLRAHDRAPCLLGAGRRALGRCATILPRGHAHFFDGAPAHLREKLREDAQFRVAENYLLSGLGRHAPDEDVDLAVRSLFALSVQLGDKPFLMGETPCGMDATAFGAVAGILTPFFESPLRQRAEQFANLTAYVDRMMLLYYPEFAWAPLQQAA